MDKNKIPPNAETVDILTKKDTQSVFNAVS